MTTATVAQGAEQAAPTAAREANRRVRGGGRDRGAGWVFMAPFLVLFALFLVWPVIQGIYLSFTNASLTGAGQKFVGFLNYGEALSDPIMWQSILNTVYFTVLSTIPLVIIGLIMALLVHIGLPGQWLWRLSFFLPYLLASSVISLIWAWLFNPSLGSVNAALGLVGIKPVAWLQDSTWSMIAIVIATVWWTVGFNFLLYLSALQNIPEQQYEAAQLDGAGRWRQLFSITLPQLGPTTALIVILQVLASLKVFDQIYLMLGQTLTSSTRSTVGYVYETGFTQFRFGYSSAISYIFFILIVLVTLIQFRATARRA